MKIICAYILAYFSCDFLILWAAMSSSYWKQLAKVYVYFLSLNTVQAVINACLCLQRKCNRSLLLIHKITLHEQRVIQALLMLLREGLVGQPFKCHPSKYLEENNLFSAPGNDVLVPKIHSQHLSLFCSSWGNIFGCYKMRCWTLYD